MDYDVRLKSNGAYWQAWWPDPDAHNGRRVRSLGAKAELSQRQARALCRKLAVDLAMGVEHVDRRRAPRLSEWIERYQALRTDQTPGTRKLTKMTGQYLTRYFETDSTIDRITRADAADWRRALAAGELSLDNRQHCDPPNEQTVCGHVRRAKTLFGEAEAQELISANPFSRLRSTPPKPVREWRHVDAADLRRILDACPNGGWKALFALCRCSGLRRGEALRLRWHDVKWDQNRLIVNATLDHATTKGGVRPVPIELARCPSGLTKTLQEVLEVAPEGAALVCAGVDEQNIDLKARRILRAAGITYAKPFHTLRKCLEVDWAQKYPQHVVSEWLGHSLEVSQAHYLRVPEELWEAPKPAEAAGKDGAQGQAQIVPDGHKNGRQAVEKTA